MMALESMFTLRLQHPQLVDRHRGDAGHRNDDGDEKAEEGPERHVRELFCGGTPHNVK